MPTCWSACAQGRPCPSPRRCASSWSRSTCPRWPSAQAAAHFQHYTPLLWPFKGLLLLNAVLSCRPLALPLACTHTWEGPRGSSPLQLCASTSLSRMLAITQDLHTCILRVSDVYGISLRVGIRCSAECMGIGFQAALAPLKTRVRAGALLGVAEKTCGQVLGYRCSSCRAGPPTGFGWATGHHQLHGSIRGGDAVAFSGYPALASTT